MDSDRVLDEKISENIEDKAIGEHEVSNLNILDAQKQDQSQEERDRILKEQREFSLQAKALLADLDASPDMVNNSLVVKAKNGKSLRFYKPKNDNVNKQQTQTPIKLVPGNYTSD
ncbi:hypothetical protein MKW92_033737 [Papaver armeniacum]|nr:hypothetical protein MKW92_033737 [Papaver armeniacum]